MDEQRLCLGVVNKQDASVSLWQGFGQCRGRPRPRPTPPHPLAKFFFVPRFPQLRPLPLGLSPQASLMEPEAARRGRGRQTADQHEVSCSPWAAAARLGPPEPGAPLQFITAGGSATVTNDNDHGNHKLRQ